ncbi:multidrug DMT transporter permease [Skermanella stibiiresistens SB22]|uniref:Multidrug DMT transporter permease n=1 Tax=Skermanella stibiiresistens SB22 TaxID=1385369 RepID=W9GWW4_9PROT|nr:EamA family transporter [Skermanella stibiiresistens]EWY36947.1 multidrug DMT transporter permease [Skermanella stibiiresistens SB22]
MTPGVLAAVMCAALLHAGWNAVLRGGGDRLWSMTLMMIAVTCVTAVASLFLPWPNAASWPYVIASAIIHTAYNLSLVRTYRSGDLGQTYPISRGSSPVLVALGAAVFAGETLDAASSLGIALVSGGILSLAFQGRGVRADFLPAAVTTGVLIGAYTVVDGIGVRLSGDSLAYANTMFLLWSVTMPVIFLATGRRPPRYTPARTVMALAGGLVSILAYGIVIWAMRHDAMGVVSALRETSVVFAALIGWIFLKEKLSARRMISCVAIALGAACLAY